MNKLMPILLTLIFASFIGVVAQKAPILRFDCGSKFDWGDVKYIDSSLECAVKIFNDGNDTLRIAKVKPSCGCTTPVLDKRAIAPSDFGTVLFKLNLSRKSGRVSKKVTFVSNDLSQNTHVLFLEANVNAGYTLSPRTINMRNIAINKEAVVDFSLENTSDSILLIDSIKVSPASLNITGIPTNLSIISGEQIDFSAHYTPDKLGREKAEIVLYTHNNPDVSDIFVRGYLKANKVKFSDTVPKSK